MYNYTLNGVVREGRTRSYIFFVCIFTSIQDSSLFEHRFFAYLNLGNLKSSFMYKKHCLSHFMLQSNYSLSIYLFIYICMYKNCSAGFNIIQQ